LSNSADFVSDETYFNAGFIGLPYTDSKRNVFFYHDPDSLFRDHDAADIKASNDRTWRLFTNN
jgi:hypothetical protein